MKVTFIGDPKDPADETKCCTMFGRDFFRGIETDVSDLGNREKDKLRGNHHFQVNGDEPAKRGPGRPRKVETDGDVSDEAAA